MLYLIGTGLSDEKDISLRGIELCRDSDKVYLEAYTSLLPNLNKKNLESLIGKKVADLSRREVESGGEILEHAGKSKVSLLVVGDPMVATTHIDLVQRARKEGIAVKIVHNASIMTSVSECGLQAYKFGRTTTVVAGRGNYAPTSFYEVLRKNRERGLHTLLLLDLDVESGKFMTIREALEILIKIDDKKGVLTPETEVVGFARLGSPDQAIAYGPAGRIMVHDFGRPLHALAVPGKMHEMEKEALDFYSIGK